MTTSMFPTTPTKKALTDDVRSAIDASNTHRDTLVPEDLSVALQALGSRVRKSVTEGYNTQRVTTFTVPTTPASSPAKPTAVQSTPTSIFQTANDAFNSVFLSGSPHVPLTPSPKKRLRADDLNDAEACRTRDGDVEMEGDGEDSDEDQVMVILGPDANSNALSPPRNIKPLRRGMMRNHGPPLDPFVCSSQTASVDLTPPLAAPLNEMQGGMDLSEGGSREIA